METYHVGDSYPPIDWLLKRDGEYVDPTDATAIEVNFRIKGSTIQFTKTLAGGEVSVVEDDDGNNRIRCTIGASDLDTAGKWEAQAVITWADGTETSPLPHEFNVMAAWT